MNATFRQLQLFLATVDKGGISAAARACHVTQPTVSTQLRDLADSVGLALFEQIGKKLHLTSAGHALVGAARSMTDEWASFEQQIAGLRGLECGQLRIAVVSTAQYFVPRMIGSFCKEHPEIDISLEVLNRDGVVARLQENRDDLYIMSMPPSNIQIERRVFLPNPLVVVAPRSHRFSGRKRIRLEQLVDERFILRENGSGTRLACDDHFAKTGFSPNVRLELGSNEAIKEAVAAEMGIAVLSQHALPLSPSEGALAVLNVTGFPIHSQWSIIFPRGKRLSPIAAVFLGHLERAGADLRTLLR